MAFNKTKHIEAAQKYLQQGKLPQAIAEYQQMLKHEPKDQVTLMTLGDLYVRQGETFQALEYFERLAKLFLNDGFTTKAIAIYKKVAKLAPEESRPLERLAELYVQQGVMSEARPLYLQLAEAQLKAGNEKQAGVLFRKLLDAEPDNMRVQTKLGELYVSMGQQKEAIDIFHGAVQRLIDRGDHAEALRLADRLLQIDAAHVPTITLKARALSAIGRSKEAASLLESLPGINAGGENGTLLVELYMDSAQPERAALFAQKIYAEQPKNYALTHYVATTLLEAGDFDGAQSLLGLIRGTMTDSGEHEALAQSLTRLAERRPGKIEPLEWLVDLYGRASDSFRLPDALAQLAQALEAKGDVKRALTTYEQLFDRSPEDEATRRQCVRLRAKLGLEPTGDEATPPIKTAPPEPTVAPTLVSPEPKLDDETQRYVTQAITDVDLFSSYGLTQKAVDLLENVVQRASRHTPILERLFDLSVGTGNDRRTAELATLLEEIAIERKDCSNIEKYAEFRRRSQRAAALAPAETAEPKLLTAALPPEFAVPIIDAELDETFPEHIAISTGSVHRAPQVPLESVVHEVDLSDEWAALSQHLEDTMEAAPALPAKMPATVDETLSAEVLVPVTPSGHAAGETAELSDEPAFELELQSPPSIVATPSDTLSADTLIAELADELQSATSILGIPAELAQLSASSASKPATIAPVKVSAQIPAKTDAEPAGVLPSASSDNGASRGPLSDLLEDFRSEMAEMETGKDDEDLETHYNLGIAYREMGLLDEAISEFQKVAKATEKGAAFRYAMQCCTLLGLAFMEKGQSAIAAIWYERALTTPGLDPEAILALRYDLGIAQELAGEVAAAFKSFSQVYAMNIDYRDVSERIALLGKGR